METYQPSWRGKNLSTRKDSQGKYMAMLGTDALLYVPIKVEQNATYRVSIEAARGSGNGVAYCNIYGNKNFDFPQAEFTCDSNDWTLYTLNIKTGSFPKTVPMVFRIWRKPSGNGSLLVRKVLVEFVEKEEEENNDRVLKEIKGLPANIAKNIPMVDKKGTPIKKEIIRPVERKSHHPNGQVKGGKKPKPPKKRRKVKGHVTRAVGVASTRKLLELPPLVPGEDGIKNSVIISIKNRIEFLNRTLYSYERQTMSKNEFEIIIVDDGSTDDLLGLCKLHARRCGLQFQYIKVDTSKGAVKQCGFTPALTNNIGFKNARGSVLVITGPETLQAEGNMVETWESCKEPRCVYGVVYKSGPEFVDYLKLNESWYKYENFDEVLSLKGAREGKPDLTGFWWYYAAARKEYIMGINGVDEMFMQGICGEDDDFANRMRFSGVRLTHNNKIVGIHQNHYREDRKDNVHNIRFNKKVWKRMRRTNSKHLEANLRNRDPVANHNIDWGTSEAITDKEIF